MAWHIPGGWLARIAQFFLGGYETSCKNCTKVVWVVWEAWLAAGIAQCAIRAGLLAVGTAQCAISAGSGYRPSDCIVQFSRPVVIVPQNCAMQDWRIVTGKKCAFPERKTEPSLSGLHNVVLVRQSSGQVCPNLPTGNWKQMRKWMHGDTECK